MEYFKKYWYQFALLTYIIICLFDFIGVPIILSISRTGADELIMALHEAEVPETIMKQLGDLGKAQTWIPFTLRGGGMFHISFGAILTGTIIGKRKKDETS